MSNLNATLSSAAIRIAQSIGLHKIVGRPASIAGSAERRHETIEIELGKRVWWQMTIQDHFAIPFTDSYSINPAHFTTEIPSNCDDVDLTEKEDNVPTVSSYVRTLASMARLMPSLLDKLGPIQWREPTLEQYRTIIDFDYSMRQLVSSIPMFLLRDEGQSTPSPPWLSIARRSLAITAADKIIMIHRPFLFQSFQSRSFTHTRSTCVAAAITILREHEKIVLEDDVSIWTHSAFCVTAIIVLCLEMLYCRHAAHETDASTHRPEPDAATKERLYEELVRSAKDRLAGRQDDVLAERGVRLADLILSEAETRQAMDVMAGPGDKESQIGVVNFGRIMARYVQQENMARGSSMGAREPDQFSFDGLHPGCGPGEEGMDGLFPDTLDTSVQSFDAWFNEIFGYERGI
ncbi:putative transcription factor lepB [Lasiodiplodia theobromae]|uniref:Putative transcription factor lepB n=1 Tax=Lasiodiplodia theobromae TaxID=45133 RepID=A0A5N5D465_9PEZI|nr:putative transcription factor lepB [Lasiodiplodia theobromae]